MVRRVNFFTKTSVGQRGWLPDNYRLRHRDTYANANRMKPAAPDGITNITSSMMTP
jgi:hypothetical protein